MSQQTPLHFVFYIAAAPENSSGGQTLIAGGSPANRKLLLD
jgi:hypothetical protein